MVQTKRPTPRQEESTDSCAVAPEESARRSRGCRNLLAVNRQGYLRCPQNEVGNLVSYLFLSLESGFPLMPLFWKNKLTRPAAVSRPKYKKSKLGHYPSWILIDFMGRTHPARRLWPARIINHHPILAAVQRQTISVRSPLLSVVDVRRIALQDRDLVDVRVLTPVSGAALARLDQHHVALRDGALDFVSIFLQVNIGHLRGHPIGPLLNVHIRFVMQQAIRIGIPHKVSRGENRDDRG